MVLALAALLLLSLTLAGFIFLGLFPAVGVFPFLVGLALALAALLLLSLTLAGFIFLGLFPAVGFVSFVFVILFVAVAALGLFQLACAVFVLFG